MSKFSGKTIEKYKIRIAKMSDQDRFAKLNPREIWNLRFAKLNPRENLSSRNLILAKIYPNKVQTIGINKDKGPWSEGIQHHCHLCLARVTEWKGYCVLWRQPLTRMNPIFNITSGCRKDNGITLKGDKYPIHLTIKGDDVNVHIKGTLPSISDQWCPD